MPVKRKRNWNTLIWRHGPILPAKYIPLPRNIKLRYNKKNVNLSLLAEEGAVIYTRYIAKYGKNKLFNENFFESWREEWMNKKDRSVVKEWRKCDFTLIRRYMEKQKKKILSEKEKIREKAKRRKMERIKESHRKCIVDGKEQRISGAVEPPGIYIGRGENPYLGRLKKRVNQKDIILNCSEAPRGRWKEVVYQPYNDWIAKYKNIDFHERSEYKFIRLSNDSQISMKKEKHKYDKARELGRIIKPIRRKYNDDVKSRDEIEKQMGVALFFIDQFCFRVGTEKGADEADTVGCCTLRREHVKIKKDGRSVEFNFYGKDSISYKKTQKLPKQVYDALSSLIRTQKSSEKLFKLRPDNINDYLKRYMPGLTAKIFRTYNASILMEKLLRRKANVGKSLEDKKVAFAEANLKVAQLCNHQKTSDSANRKKIQNLKDKIKKKEGQIKNAQRSKRQKLIAELRRLRDKERMTKLIGPYALETSKANYIDPRIVIAWCKRNKVPVTLIYSQVLRNKFRWAMKTPRNYVFNNSR